MIILTTGPDGRQQLAKFLPFGNQHQGANFTEKGKHYMVRCYTCPGNRENYMAAAATGACAWCGDSMYRQVPNP